METATKAKAKKAPSPKGKNSKPGKAKAAKVPKAARKAPEAKERALSGLDAAAKVLKESGKPLNCKAMVAMMLDKGYWKTDGKTPWATLYSAIIREVG